MLRLILGLGTSAIAGGASSPTRLELGANFNENLHAARRPTLDAAHVTWIRGFLPALEFIQGSRSLASDPGLTAFRAAAASGRKVALSLKWDFRRTNTRVPAPGSALERACFAWAREVVEHGRPDLLLLNNEYFPDTLEPDTLPDAAGGIPMVGFLQRLSRQLHDAGLKSARGAPLPLACGGFTRLDLPRMQQHPSVLALLGWLATSPEHEYVSLHLHQRSLAQFTAALQFVRGHVRHKPLVVTEFSLVWAYQEHLGQPVAASAAGRHFAREHGLAPAMTVLEYLNTALAQPVPEVQWHAFLNSQTWYNPGFLEQSCRLMEEHGVVLATYAFLSETSGARAKLKPGDPPWRLNPIFAERFARSPDPSRPAINPDFFASFVARQRR